MTNKERFLKLVSEDDTQTLIEIKNRIKKRMEKTAVEWLLTYLPQIDYGKDPYYKEIINQAKEMEKEQIIDVWIDAYTTNMKSVTRDNFTMWANNYYNEKFNK